MREYYRAWLRRAVVGALRAVGFKGQVEAVRTVVLWALSVLFLYGVNWHHVPVIGAEDPGASSEVRLGLSALAGIVLVFVLTFLWQLVTQPAAIDQEKGVEEARRLAEARAEIERHAEDAKQREAALREHAGRLQGAIDALFDAEETLQRLSELHREGRALYKQEADPETWDHRMAAWSAGVEQIIRENFSIAALHEYRSHGSGAEIMTTWSWPAGTDHWLKARYTAKLSALDDIVRRGQPFFSARMNLSRRTIAP